MSEHTYLSLLVHVNLSIDFTLLNSRYRISVAINTRIIHILKFVTYELISIDFPKAVAYGGDMMRKSIVFDKKTPDVFYCPQQKPKSECFLLIDA